MAWPEIGNDDVVLQELDSKSTQGCDEMLKPGKCEVRDGHEESFQGQKDPWGP